MKEVSSAVRHINRHAAVILPLTALTLATFLASIAVMVR